MSNLEKFDPDLSILPPAQRRLWDELIDVPDHFTLYGGTAIALQLGHRQSVDFDFFSRQEFDPDKLVGSVPLLKDADIVRRESDTLIARIDRGGPVMVAFFATPDLGQVANPLQAADNNLKVASLIDLAGTKADVVQKRAEAKDYQDLGALMDAGINLPQALSAGKQIQGPQFNPQITLKALSYFDDGDLKALPAALKRQLQNAVRAADLSNLPDLPPRPGRGDPTPGGDPTP